MKITSFISFLAGFTQEAVLTATAPTTGEIAFWMVAIAVGCFVLFEIITNSDL